MELCPMPRQEPFEEGVAHAVRLELLNFLKGDIFKKVFVHLFQKVAGSKGGALVALRKQHLVGETSKTQKNQAFPRGGRW